MLNQQNLDNNRVGPVCLYMPNAMHSLYTVWRLWQLQIAGGFIRQLVAMVLTWGANADGSTADRQAGNSREVHVLVFGEGEGKANPKEIRTIKVTKAA